MILRVSLGLVALIALAVLVLFLLGRRRGAGEHIAEIWIAQPRAEVWRFMSDPELVKKWVGGLVELETLAGTELAVGTRDRMIVMIGSKRHELHSEITAVDPGKSLSQRIVSAPGAEFPFEEHATFELEDDGEGTRFRISARARYQGIARLFEPLISYSARHKLDDDVARLKAVAEGGDQRGRASTNGVVALDSSG